MVRGLTCLVLVVVLSSPILPQSSQKPLAFDIADIHPSDPNAVFMKRIRRGPYIAGGRFELQYATILDMIRIAYNPANAGLDSLGRRTDQLDADKVVGGPSGLDFNQFDVIAKAPPQSSLENIKVMLQTLLATRFKLAIHNGSVPIPAYALTAGKKPLLKESDGSEQAGCRQLPISSAGPGSMVSYACRNMTMAALADSMRSMSFANISANLNNNRVVDQTGLKGSWNFDFKYSIPGSLSGAAPGDILTFAEAVRKQLGLELVLTKVPSPVLVVDSVSDGPTPNPPGLAKALPPLPEAFEVAEVKPTAPGFRGGKFQVQPNGRVEVQNSTLRDLILRAWGLPIGNSFQTLVGPKFMDDSRFDIVAKAPMFGPPPDGTAAAPQSAEPLPAFLLYQYTNADSIDPMLQTLLIERFGLTFHNEDRPLPSLTLHSDKPKLQKADPTRRTGCHTTSGPAGNPLPNLVMTCENITMAQFAANLPLYDIPSFRKSGLIKVVDATRLKGGWDFTLTYAATRAANPFSGGGGVQTDDPGGTSLFEAIGKQLGFKLEQTKSPGKMMVIDHLAEKPREP